MFSMVTFYWLFIKEDKIFPFTNDQEAFITFYCKVTNSFVDYKNNVRHLYHDDTVV